jgi:FKBP12-rapamycin complex-associated protein
MAKEVRLHRSKLADSRLDGCQRDVEVWQRILQLRSMVLTPKDDMKTWLNFADLCRTSDRLTLADKTISALVGHNAMDPDVSDSFRTTLTL